MERQAQLQSKTLCGQLHHDRISFRRFISLIPMYGLSEVGGGFLLLAFLLMWNLYFLWAVRGVIYFVTDRRILKKSPRVLVKRTEEVTLSMVIDVRAKRFLGTNQLVFRTSEGKTLTFRALRQDPQSIQQIAIDAKKKVSPNSPVP